MTKKKALRAMEILKQLEKVKPLYAELDEIAQDMAKTKIPCIAIGRKHLFLKDNFAERNTAWKSTAIRRFELEVG